MELPSKRIERARSKHSDGYVRAMSEEWFWTNYVERKAEVMRPHQIHNLRAHSEETDALIEPTRKPMLEVGRMYTFKYNDPKYKKELEFYNAFPIVLCIGHIETESGKMNPLCISLHFIPPKIRTAILDKIVKTFNNSVIDPNIVKLEKGEFNLRLLPARYDVLKRILRLSGFEFAITSYIYARIKTKPMIVSYMDWWRVCTFSSKFIRKLHINAIYYRYKKEMLDPAYKIGQKNQPTVRIATTKVSELRKLLRKSR
jgi:hypothetical protein